MIFNLYSISHITDFCDYHFLFNKNLSIIKIKLSMVINMTWAVKLKVFIPDCKKVYETGNNNIKSININFNDGIIEITQDIPEWDHIVIPFNTMKYFKYKEDIHSLI